MKEFIAVVLMAIGVSLIVPKGKNCTSPYKNTLQHDIYRECK